MNEAEWQTRKSRIDTRLLSLSPRWEIIRYRDSLDLSKLRCHAVETIPSVSSPAAYGLFVNGLFLGIHEAKKAVVNPQNVLEQAKRYSSGALKEPGQWNGCRVPILFASIGEIIWFLALAFAGQLVPRDPNEEPAQKLSDKIKTKQTKPRK